MKYTQAQASQQLVARRPEEFGLVNCAVNLPAIEIHSTMSFLGNVLYRKGRKKVRGTLRILSGPSVTTGTWLALLD
jgi:hypothetical protein